MNAKRAVVCSLLLVLGSVPAMNQEVETYSAREVHRAMFDAISAIEEATGLEPRASRGLAEMSDEAIEVVFASIANRKQFVSSARQVVDRINSVTAVDQIDGTDSWPTLTGTAPYPPAYPNGYSDASFLVARALGLTKAPSDRCDGTGLDIYADVLAVAEALMVAGDAACAGAQCDPIGVVCGITCGLVEHYRLAYLAAKVPLTACAAHQANVDSAEIEAGYENTVSLLYDLADHDAQLDALEAMMTDVLANQEEIIKLLKTPHGRREGWPRRP